MMFRRITALIMSVLLCLLLLPTEGLAKQDTWTKSGNTDINILNGGVMLRDGGDFYFVENGIFVQKNDENLKLSSDRGKNLNLYNGYIYYTVGSELRRVPQNGGNVEKVFSAGTEIKQLYVLDGDIEFLAGGRLYKESKDSGSIKTISAITDVEGFIPTQYGDVLLQGKVFDYTIMINGKAVLTNVTSCYTDSGYLAVSIQNENYMIELKKLFNGFDAKTDLLDFNIHGTIALATLLKPDDAILTDKDVDNDKNLSTVAQSTGDTGTMSLMADDVSNLTDPTQTMTPETTQSPEVTLQPTATPIPTVSEGQKNIVKRARQLTEIKWTPLEDIYQWGQAGVFKAETTYTGIPYGQPINCNGYIGYGVSIETFASSVLDNTSKFYTTYSTYNKTAPSMSTDCSGYVSYAWGLVNRLTTYSMTGVASIVSDQSIYSLQIGDCIDKTSSHIVLVSGLSYDSAGNITGIEIMEETPVITRVTKYGNGASKTLSNFQSSYLNNGFVIYRNPNRDSVTYTPNPAVPLDGEAVEGMKEPAPKSHTTSVVGGKNVTLSSNTGDTIYYTLDGSIPTATSTKYTEAIKFSTTNKLRAIAVSGSFSGSTILEYTVKIPQAPTPTPSVSSGFYSGNLVSSGAQIKLTAASGATIHYTTDGTQPTVSSKAYSAPITITSDTTIKAIAEAKGMSLSQTAEVTYKIGAVYTISASSGAGGTISPAGNSSVFTNSAKAFTITPSDGFAISDVLVDGVSQGAAASYTFSNVSANHSIAASFKSASQLPFTDAASSDWFYKAVQFAYAKSLFNGTSATTFSPTMTMTRGMFVTVLGRYAGIPSGLGSGIGLVSASGVNIRSGPSTDTAVAGYVPSKNTVVQVLDKSGSWYNISFGSVTGYIRNDLMTAYDGNYSDLAENQYYSPYVKWAGLSGIANNVASDTFSADSDITREDMCLMLYNYALAYGKTLPSLSPKAAFTDDSSIRENARDAVYALQEAEIINGMGDGTFLPQGTARRAQVAQIYMKFINTFTQSS